MPKSRSDRILKGMIAVLFAGLIFILSDVFHQRIVQAGDKAPSFSITTDDGRQMSSANYGGKLLVLNFWATWCPPCIDEMPSLNDFAQQMKPRGVVVLGISVDKNEQAYKRFIEAARLQFPTARDPDAGISAEYGTFMWPETYVINSQGTVVRKYVGPRNWTSSEIVSDLMSLL